MANGGSKSLLSLVLAIVSFVIAGLALTGALAGNVPGGKWIFGIIFIVFGIYWLIRLLKPKDKN